MEGESEILRLKRFDGTNFQLWKFQTEIVLDSKGLLDLVKGQELRTDTNAVEWDKKHARAKMIIATAMEYGQLQYLVNCATAMDMWARLASIHEQKTATSKHVLHQKFFAYSMDPNDDMATHISKIESLARQLKDLGEDVSDSAILTKIICSLPSSYRNMVTAWDSVPETERTINNLTARLLKEESMNKLWNEGEVKPAAFTSKGQRSNFKPNVKNSAFKHDKKIEQKKLHSKCGHCKEIGHWWRECPKRRGAESNFGHSSKHNYKASNSDSGAFNAESQAILTVSKDDAWWIDSGATDHMTNRKDWMKDFVEIEDGKHPVRLGDNNEVYALGKGAVQIWSLVNGNWHENRLENVLYVPDLGKNLFSVGTVADKGFRVVFENDTVRIVSDTGQLKAVGIRKGFDLYRMLFKPRNQVTSQGNSVQSLRVWHERLAHVNVNAIKNMIKRESVIGLQVSDEQDFFCEGCSLGKQHQLSFVNTGKKRVSKPGELIHADICGPMSVNSINGSKYFLLLKDDYSSYRTVYFLRDKTEVIDKMRDFLIQVKHETGYKVGALRTDNGTEFVNGTFKKFLREKGIRHEVTVPYCPQQNGFIERENRTVVEAARSMIFDKNLPIRLWAEATYTAVYLLNRIGTKSMDWVTSYELWTGRKPSVEHIKTFGTEAFALVPQVHRKKWEKKSKKLTLVGYCDDNKSYRLWCSATDKVVLSRDVQFNELGKTNDISSVKQMFFKMDEPKETDQETNDKLDFEDKIQREQKLEQSLLKEETKQEDNPWKGRLRSSSVPQTAKASSACLAFSEPKTFDEALNQHDSKNWIEAMEDEYESLMTNETWQYCTLPPERKALKCMWVYKVKHKTDGSIDRYKARLVIKGCAQKPGIDYEETFAPVVRFESVRTLLSIAAAEDLEMMQFDIRTAFLYGELDENIFMEEPEGFVEHPGKVCKLNKSLYGLKQAPRQWNKTFSKFLLEYDLKQSTADPCVFYSKGESVVIYIAIYVDDGIVMSNDKQTLTNIISHLKGHFQIHLTNADCFIGLEIQRNRNKRELFICQSAYAQAVLKRFNMFDCNPISVPADPHVKFSQEMFPRSDEGNENKCDFPYREAIGSLLYLVVGTRPDLAFVVSTLSQYMTNPHMLHWKGVQRVLKYLKGTLDYGICFSGSDNCNSISGYCDTDWAGDLDTRRSTNGCVFIFNNGPVAWISQKQKSVALSTAEAEYMACSAASREIVWLRKLLDDLGKQQATPTDIFCDNLSAIRLVKNPEFHKRTKHIDIHFHFIREKWNEGLIDVSYVSTDNQLADIFTKAVTPEKFKRLRTMIGIVSRSDIFQH